MTREEAARVLTELADDFEKHELSENGWLNYVETTYIPAHRMGAAALREKAERERGCAYCVIGRRSPDAEYCSNCGRKLTPTLPELANESELDYIPANVCVACGAEMPEGDQVCSGCRRIAYPPKPNSGLLEED